MKPVFVVGGLYSEANGVAQIMRGLAAALGRAGAPVTVYGAECYGRASVGKIFQPPSRWIATRGLWLGGLSWAPRLKRLMREGICQADVVHNHSVWMLPNSYGSRLARAADKPVVITAHGVLEPWALAHSGWKKRCVGRMFQTKELREAQCIHVNSRAEVAGVRAYGITAPIAIIPNGITLSDLEPLPTAAEFHAAFPDARNRKIALFMARLHVKKGLEHLLQAWGKLHQEYPEWRLVIAGPDDGYESEARALAERLGLENDVAFTGNLQGRMRRAALSAAEVFVLPSFSEGFSMAVLEALACRVPALITPGCNFSAAAAAGAAVEVPSTVEGTIAGLTQLLSLSDDQRDAMGSRARNLIEQHYTWDRVAQSMLEVYRWLIGGGPRPATVIED